MVAARETTVQELLQGSFQYQVPLYQRTYAWSKDQLGRLWNDILKVADDRVDDPKSDHFIGSLVLAPSPKNGPSGVAEYLVVDGQQRLTSLSLLLCAMRDHLRDTVGTEHVERINDSFLINKYAKSYDKKTKLAPTQADRPAYEAVLWGAPTAGGDKSRVAEAYSFFRGKLAGIGEQDPELSVESVEDVLTSGLALVAVTTQPGDNAHRIFESLNNTGLQLTQGDLLRNYVFMRMPQRGPEVYEKLWKPLQAMFSDQHLEQLFWLDLVQVDARAKQGDTYARQQARLDRLKSEDDLEREVIRWVELGKLFRVILDPSLEENEGVRERLLRLRDWGTLTVHPLLLHLLDRRAVGDATSVEVAEAMLYVESYLVRRILIGRATANLNRTLLGAVTEMRHDLPVDEAVRLYLSQGRKYFATDQELAGSLRSLPFYLQGRKQHQTLILRWIEKYYQSKEPVDMTGLTIEHVLPQTLTEAWKEELSSGVENVDLEQLHSSVVHTIGNLTLTGYNSTLSNGPFEKKREKLFQSGLAMNQEIAAEKTWGVEQILGRADRIAELVASTWPGPTPDAGAVAADGVRWDVLHEALAMVPPGRWTTYGALAALVGTFPLKIGSYLGSVKAPNPHRVLRSDGRVSPDFAWLDGSVTVTPGQLLEEEGLTFDHLGRAAKDRYLDVADLAQLFAGEEPEGSLF